MKCKCGDEMDVQFTCLSCGSVKFADNVVNGNRRYEKMRKMTPRQFDSLWEDNLRGMGRFDELVDDFDLNKN